MQTAAEELAFRGYLLQGLAARFRSRLLWWGAPALLFGLLHWSPREGWPAVLAAAALGLILADVTARSGNLSAAIGLHFANNAVALLVVAMPSPLAGLSLFVAGVDPADAATVQLLLLSDLAVTLIAYAVWLGFWARRRRLHFRPPELSDDRPIATAGTGDELDFKLRPPEDQLAVFAP